jgi:hypothetical protein
MADDDRPQDEHGQSNEDWIRRMRARPARPARSYDISALMDEVRDEFGC